MKRFALVFAALAVSISITGCGESTPTGAPGDPNLPSEVREYEARREAETRQAGHSRQSRQQESRQTGRHEGGSSPGAWGKMTQDP